MENEYSPTQFPFGQRAGAAVLGIFLMAFGTPFTMVPFLVLPAVFSMGFSFFAIFLSLFCLPFFLAGLFVQYMGFNTLRLALFPNSKHSIKTLQGSFGGMNHQSEARTESFIHHSNPRPEEEKSTVTEPDNFWSSIE
jgi:hypothetical protein